MDVEDSSSVEENLKHLREAMSKLKSLRENLDRSGGLHMDGWRKDLDVKEKEVAELSKKFDEVSKRAFGGLTLSRYKLNRKVLRSLHEANALIARASEIPDSVEMFMSEMASTKTIPYASAQLEKYMGKPATKIGSGEFGDVYKAKLPNGLYVAVKVLKCSLINEMEKQFIAEVSTMSKIYHRNLVQLYGYCFDAKMKALVYEYLECGSLENILDGKHHHVEWSNIYDVAVGTARALSYLHEHCNERIIHRNIKPGNILLDANYVPRISDFGLAKLYSTDKSRASKTLFKRAHSYDAPEVRMGWDLTYKCDVFSFGMMLLDILGRKTASEGKKSFAKKVWEKFEEKNLDQILEECGIGEKDKKSAEKLSKVALCCIQEFVDNRPSMSTVLKVLEGDMQLPPPDYPFGISDETPKQGRSTFSRGSY